MGKKVKLPKQNTQKLIKEHQSLMTDNGGYYNKTQPQWTQVGDYFEKFTMYGHYTPVKTSTGSGGID